MSQKHYLGLDVGTQSVKGLVFDPEHEDGVVARAGKPLDLLEGLPAGAAEQHPDDWWQAVIQVVRELGQQTDLQQIAGVGVSGQQHGSVFLDASGVVVRPAKLWCDTSTADEAQQLTQKLGRSVPVGVTASKVTWLARHAAENWQRTAHVLPPPASTK